MLINVTEICMYVLKSTFDGINLVQMTRSNTCSRVVNGVHKESLLDHLHTADPMSVGSFVYPDLPFGEHSLVTFQLWSINVRTNI